MYDTQKPYKARILSLIQQTWRDNPYVIVRPGIYPVFERKNNGEVYWDVDHTDGLGTKGMHHWNQRTFYYAVIDALAMNLNDLAISRAVPYKTQCHLMLPQDDHSAIREIMENMAEECQTRKIVITGGETSIHENLVGMELSLTMTGTILGRPMRNSVQIGDVLLGYSSNGIHSNGLTKARKILGNEERPDFTVPTRVYLDKLRHIYEKANGLMHISGGAFTKLKQILPSGADIELYQLNKLRPQRIFWEMYDKNVADEEMYSTFNCGVGFIVSMSLEDASPLIESGDVDIIGEVKRGTGLINLKSVFTNKHITF